MSARKLTEVAVGSTPTEDTHFLVTQPETVNNETMEAVRRPTSGSIKDLIAGGLIAPKFSDQSSYAAGSYVLKNGVLYRFTSAHTGAWTGTDAETVTVGEELTDLKTDLDAKTGLSEEVKQRLLACFTKVVWIDEHGKDYYDALEDALYPPVSLKRITAVYTQSGTVYTTDSLDSLKPDLVVTAYYSDGTSGIVMGYVLSGVLTEGTSTITVSYGGKSAIFSVTVVLFVPSGYTLVSCITANNSYPNSNQYIKTGIYPTGGDEFVLETSIKWDATQPSTTYNGFGANQFMIISKPQSVYRVNAVNTPITADTSDFEVIKLTGTATGANMPWTFEAQGQTATGTRTNAVTTYPFQLFSYKSDSRESDGGIRASMKYFKLSKNGTLIVDMIPCVRDLDSVAGFYDIVSETFFPSSGSENFSYTR